METATERTDGITSEDGTWTDPTGSIKFTADGKLIQWLPLPRQEVALSCPAQILFYGGAKGGGKSDYLLMDYASGIAYGSDYQGIIFRNTYPQLEELLKRAHELYPVLGGRWIATKRTYLFPSGATLKFRYLERDSDVLNYNGHQYQWIGFDEITNWRSDYSFRFMIAQARSSKGVPCRIRCAGNPGLIGHAWVKAMFIDGKLPEHIYTDPETGMTMTFIPARLQDNTILMQNDPGYLTRLRVLPPHLQRAFIDGDWDINVGQFFEEFRRDLHVIKPQRLDPSWTRFCSMDWGYNKPFSIGWWAVTGDGRMFRYREWYGCEQHERDKGIRLPAKKVAQRAWEMSINEGCDIMVADPAVWSKIDDVPSVAEIFESVGWRMEKGINDRINGWQRMHELLKTTGVDNRPMLLVSETCHHFIRTVPTLVYDEKRLEDVDTTQEDHIADETRYAIMSQYATKTTKATREPVDMSKSGRNTRADYNPLRRRVVKRR